MSAYFSSEGQRSEHGLRASHARRRSRASLACINCRARKVKCDLQTSPEATCTACRISKTRCVFNPTDDRRKSSSRESMSAIQERLVTIESMMRQTLQQAQLALPTSSHQTDRQITASCSDIDRNQPPSTSELFAFLPNGGRPEPTAAVPFTAINKNSTEECEDSSAFQPRAVIANGNQGKHRDYDNDVDTGQRCFGSIASPSSLLENTPATWMPPTPTSPEDEPVRPWEAETENGPLRFYGPTTRPHSQLTLADLKTADVDAEIEPIPVPNLDSPQLQSMLFNAFWTWNSLSLAVPIVDETLFTEHRARGEASQYHSKFLDDIILASSSRVSSSPAVRKLGPTYAERAKTSLLQQLESPTIASLQGFLLLSDFESTSGRERIGWTYSGIASRLVFDLGLHEDCSDLLKQGKITRQEAKLRQVLFFAAFQYDSCWSLYFGRPSTISISIVNAASYVPGGHAIDKASVSTLDAWIQHCTIVHDLGNLLNNPRPLDQSTINHLSRLYAVTCAAYESLPSSIKCKDPQTCEPEASVYALNMQYCGLKIILHRIPTLLRSRKRKPDAHGSWPHTLPGFTIEESQSIKYENAVRITQLLHSFIQIYGIERVHSTMLDNMFVAASTITRHILNTQKPETLASKDVRWLQVLAEAMRSAQKHYPVTLRMMQTISSTLENTFLSGLFSSQLQVNSIPSKALPAPLFSESILEYGGYSHLDDILLEPSIGMDLDHDADFSNITWPP